MLDLKAKLLAAGVVTAAQVKKVEDEEANKKARAQQRRDVQPPARERPASKGNNDDDADEKRARREHEWNEAQRWRKRLEQLQLAGKSEQYEAVRGWVMKDRLDNKQITEAAVRFHFVKLSAAGDVDAAVLAHLTVEPDVQQQLTEGTAAVVAFMGYNGIEHAVVPKDVAVDVRVVKPEWVRHLVGVTDQETTTTTTTTTTTEPADPAGA
ncbi:MAG: DUF2058 family protein [Deltaproteobacteria bacterium]|nr:DUF2058 family protein [Deltaproteobacteria bacterium]